MDVSELSGFKTSRSTIAVNEKPAMSVEGVNALSKRVMMFSSSIRRSSCSSLRRHASNTCLSAASMSATAPSKDGAGDEQQQILHAAFLRHS
jgi:hypothetical protein